MDGYSHASIEIQDVNSELEDGKIVLRGPKAGNLNTQQCTKHKPERRSQTANVVIVSKPPRGLRVAEQQAELKLPAMPWRCHKLI